MSTTNDAANAEQELTPDAEPEAVEPQAVVEGPAADTTPEEPEAEPEVEEPPPAPAPKPAPAPAKPNAVAEQLRAARAAEREARGEAPAANPQPAAAPATPPSAPPAAPAQAPTPATEPAPEAVPAEPEAAAERQTESPAPSTFDALMEQLDEGRRSLINTHIAGLRSALSAEREANKKLEKKVKGVEGTGEELATLRTKTVALEGDVAAERLRASFYEEAVTQGVKRGSARLAFLAANDGGFVTDGEIRWADLREKYSDLFEAATPAPATPRQPAPRANAGAGLTQQPGEGRRGFNQILRDAAGRRA